MIALAACTGNNPEVFTQNSVPGWPTDLFFESAEGVVSAAESLGWRIDAADGAETGIWISGIALNAEKRALLRSSLASDPSQADVAVSKLGVPGLLLYLRDNGAPVPQSLAACAPLDNQVQCTKSDVGKIVITHLDAEHVTGAFFSNSKDQQTRYAATFDAPLANTSSTPISSANVWSSDGGEAGAVFMTLVQAATTKDTAALKSLSMPNQAAEWDHFGVISSMQRTARQQPRVIAGNQTGDDAHLWILLTAIDAGPRLPASVDMKKVDGTWKFVRMIF